MHKFFFCVFFSVLLVTLSAKSDGLRLSAESSVEGFSQKDTSFQPKDTSWKVGGIGTFNFSQAAFSNWAAGGENAVSAAAIFNFFTNYKSENISWENSLDIAYSFLKTDNHSIHKNDDKIDFTSKLGRKAGEKLFYSGLFNFKSQFSPGYNYPNDSTIISNFLAPAFILVSAGMDYKPNDYFSAFVSPASGRIIIVNDQTLANAGAFGVDKGKKVRYEFGALASLKYKKEIAKNITLATKADFFSNYLKNPQNIVVNWDFLLNLKVNKYIVTSITTSFIYDNDIPVPVFGDVNGVRTQIGTGPRTQFKEVLAIGLTYKL